MISTNQISLQPPVTAPLAVKRPASAGPFVNTIEADEESCRWQMDCLVQRIESSEIRGIVDTVVKDLMRLLECLRLIEHHLSRVDKVEETFAFFQLIREEARSLVEFIRTDALNCDFIPEELADTLDGISFAINHDLQRVFESDGNTPLCDHQTYVVLSRTHRAHDVLTNCLQQSIVSLAIAFDREMVGARLFNNSDMRHRQSLQLCQDLTTLQVLVAEAQPCGRQALCNLLTGLEKFRGESLEYLMYSDWPQFEGFCEMISLSTEDAPKLGPVLHQFQCYLETLLGQVRMRSVLADVSSGPFPEDADFQTQMVMEENSVAFSSTVEQRNQPECWGGFAFAV